MTPRLHHLLTLISFLVVTASAQDTVNINKLLNRDNLGKQLVSAVKPNNNDKFSTLLAKQPTILARTVALDIALNRQLADISKAILATGLASQKDPNGMTALMYASQYGQLAAIREIVRNGARLDQRLPGNGNGNGNNALSLAILHRQYESTRVLLELGASAYLSVYYQGGGVVYAGPESNPYYRNATDYAVIEAKKASILELAARSKDAKLISIVSAASLNNSTNPRYIIGSSDTFHVALSPDNRLMATSGADKPEIKLWTLPEIKPLKTITDQQREADLVFSPDSTLIASIGESGVILSDVSSGAIVKRIPIPGAGIKGKIAFSSDGKLLAYIVPWDRPNIEVWSTRNNDVIKQEMWPAASTNDTSHAVALGKEYIACAYYHSKEPFQIEIWKLFDKASIRRITNDDAKEYLSQLWFGVDGVLYGLIQSGSAASLKAWSIPDGTVLSAKRIQFEGLENAKIHDLMMSPNKQFGIVSYILDGGTAFGLFSLPKCEPIRTFRDSGKFGAFAVSSDGSTVIGSDGWGNVRQWNLTAPVNGDR